MDIGDYFRNWFGGGDMRGEKGEMRRDREGRGIEERVMIRDRRGNRRGREVGMREEEDSKRMRKGVM